MHPKMVEYCRPNIREKFKPILKEYLPFYMVKNSPEKDSKSVKSIVNCVK